MKTINDSEAIPSHFLYAGHAGIQDDFNLDFNVWRRLCVPIVTITFLCLWLHLQNHERLSATGAALAVDEAIYSVPIAPAAEDLGKFQATAYSITGITKSGVPVESGHVAADPKIIPLGSMIYVETPLMCGIFQVTDTGRLIKGRIIDIFIPSYKKCIEFGRRNVVVKVMRYGYEEENMAPLGVHPIN